MSFIEHNVTKILEQGKNNVYVETYPEFTKNFLFNRWFMIRLKILKLSVEEDFCYQLIFTLTIFIRVMNNNFVIFGS